MVYYIILIWVIVGLLWVVWKSYQHNEADKKEILAVEKERDEFANFGVGLEEYNKKMQDKKIQAKDKIITLFYKKNKISNKEIIKELDISHSSAMRYLDELEKEGEIKQIGKTGRSVFYTK